MKVGYDASSIRSQLSGVGHYTASLLNALQSEFSDIQLLLLSHLTQKRTSCTGLTATQKHSFPIKEIWMQFWVPRILAKYSPDVCHFTNSIAPLCLRSPYVITVHDLSLVSHPEWHPRSRRIWMRRILRPSVARASGIICDSEKTRTDLLKWIQLDSSKIWVVPLAARSRFFSVCGDRDKQRVRVRYNLSRPFILYVGNIEPRKNLTLLLQAFRELDSPDFDLAIAGRRAWLCRRILEEAAYPLSRSRVHILDYVPEEYLPALYQSALAFVYPSLMEGFGLPVLEAMASGTAVLASDVEPVRSLVGGAGWLVKPDDSEQWRDALSEALHNAEKRTALAAEAKCLASGYSWARTARETMKCYEAVLERRPSLQSHLN